MPIFLHVFVTCKNALHVRPHKQAAAQPGRLRAEHALHESLRLALHER